LYERVRINGLLDKVNKTVHRPPNGKGRFKSISQSPIHHPKGIKETKGYGHSVALLDEMRSDSDRWKSDGLSDMRHTIVQHKTETQLPTFASVHHIMCTP
jgi:hypothetical protein